MCQFSAATIPSVPFCFRFIQLKRSDLLNVEFCFSHFFERPHYTLHIPVSFVWCAIAISFRCLVAVIVATITSPCELNAKITRKMEEDAYCCVGCVCVCGSVENAKRQRKCDKVKSEMGMERERVAFAFYLMLMVMPFFLLPSSVSRTWKFLTE